LLTLAGTGSVLNGKSISDNIRGKESSQYKKEFGTTGYKTTSCRDPAQQQERAEMKDVRGFLIDLDGVLYQGDKAVKGARESIDLLKDRNYTFRFVSNTTRKCRNTIVEQVSSMGFDIPVNYIFTPSLAAVASLKNAGKHQCFLLTTGDVYRDFEQECICDSSTMVDFVIIGDAGDKLTYDSLNTAFRHLMNGADLIALEKDRYWMAPGGLSLSAGPFVQALEFATGKTATIVGKPSKTFFELALRDMGLRADQVAMIGDDILTDIGGARTMGMKGILVRTGKYREDAMVNAAVKPSCVIDSIAQLQDIL
jgi:HAD superfamily hydrolase (TIGR01458 family)